MLSQPHTGCSVASQVIGKGTQVPVDVPHADTEQ
jgi:hypothetical protein